MKYFIMERTPNKKQEWKQIPSAVRRIDRLLTASLAEGG